MAIRILQDRRSLALRDRQYCIEKSLGFRLKWDHLPAGATRCKTRFISHPLLDEAEWARLGAHRPGPQQPMLQRGPALARLVSDPGRCRPGRRPHRDAAAIGAIRLRCEVRAEGAADRFNGIRGQAAVAQVPDPGRDERAVRRGADELPRNGRSPRAGRDCGTCQECCVGFRSMKAATGQKRGLVPMAHE